MQTFIRFFLALGPGDVGIDALKNTPSSVGSIINSITNILLDSWRGIGRGSDRRRADVYHLSW